MSNEPGAPGAGDTDAIYRAPESDTSVAPEGDLLAAYVGPKYQEYYAPIFQRFESGGSSVSWHWPAFFVTIFWLLYRKMWLNFFAYWLFIPIALAVLSTLIEAVIPGATGILIGSLFEGGLLLLIAFVLVPMFANRLYYNHAQKKIGKITSEFGAPEQQRMELARKGGTSNVAIVIAPIILIALIGIIAAITIPAYQDYTIRAQVSEGLALASSSRTAVGDYYGEFNRLPADNVEAGMPAPGEIEGSYVSSVAIENGTVVVTYGNLSHETIDGKTLLLEPVPAGDDTLDWDCRSSQIPAKHLPAACR